MKPKKSIIQAAKRLLIHLILWIFVLIFFSFFIGIESANNPTKFTFSAFFLPVTISTTYIFIYHLIPKFLLPEKYLKFVFYSVYTLIISAVFIIVSAFYGFVLSFGLKWNDNFPISKSIFYIMITIYLVVAIASAFSLLKYNYATSAKNKELQNRILEAQLKLKEQELQYLKMQIHPHFLFNTLNTIYGLSLANNPSTPEMILQLSNLLDYILYQTKKPLVRLEDEVKHIQNYIELEMKRFQEDLKIEFHCEPIPEKIKIAPMLLLPFVENSFKHGKGNDGKLKISIHIKLEEEYLKFEIINSVSESTENSETEGIGLDNIKRRLNILYEKDYELKLENDSEFFQAKLILNTSKLPTDVK